MYADEITGSMERAITETERRRAKQQAYNEAHGIIPKTIQKMCVMSLKLPQKQKWKRKQLARSYAAKKTCIDRTADCPDERSCKLLEFEHAAYLRDKIKKLEEEQ